MALILDEVQTGFGRTGEMFGFLHSGAVPDVITLAKALGNGLPIGACVARGEWAEAFQAGDHATTMGGGPVVCAAALAVIETIERDGLVENSRDTGAYLKGRLQELADRHEGAVEVRGRGLLLALQMSSDCAADVVSACLDQGLLVNNVSPSAIRLCPPLILTRADCDEAIGILDGVLHGVREVQPA
jgi:acetylornithine/succinyldiaminopimelate/putrescine aminotransferase